MKFTGFFEKKLQKNSNFDFLNKFDLDKFEFRGIDLAVEYFFPFLVQKAPILPFSHEKRNNLKLDLASDENPEIM